MENMPPTTIKGEHLHQLNNYQRLKQEYTPEGKTAFTDYFQYFSDIHSVQAQRNVTKATAVQMTPHSQNITAHLQMTPHTILQYTYR
jgi:hypothetical protein